MPNSSGPNSSGPNSSGPDSSGPDPFGTAALRTAVIDSWASSPTRFREDANAEEDLRLGGYADAWCVELAQNAADAARAAGVRGRLRIEVKRGELRVANTGTPLDATGVAALASLRASAKRDDAGSVGRFGVGFAAVLAISDAPRVVGHDGGVAFSAARTAAAVAALPGPAAELARRDEPPVLRLVWPADEVAPDGYDTEVRLPLRPEVDPAALLKQAREAAPDLLLALPGLVEIDVAGEILARVDGPEGTRIGDRAWRLARRSGQLDDDEARRQATEQRGRRDWAVCWALPLGPDGHPTHHGDDVLHAPTATVEALALPARLIATVPMEPDRRRVRLGAATDRVLAEAAQAYLDLVRAVDLDRRRQLVPETGFPRSALDGRLHDLLLGALRTARWLPGAGGSELLPGRAEWLDLPGERLPALLAGVGFDRLATAPVPASLGAHRVSAAEMVARLFGVEASPGWWRECYVELEPAAETVPGLLDELRALPVPLHDGRTAAGPATVLLAPDPPVAAITAIGALALPGLYLAHPDGVAPLLRRLGAVDADASLLLEHVALAEAVDRSVDDAEAGLDPGPLAEAVLALVGERGTAPAALSALALPDADGHPARADELMLPDAVLRPLLAPDAPIDVLDAALAARVPRDVLVAVGVLDGFAVIVDDDPTGPDHDLDDEERWWEAAAPTRLVAVRDLDLVAADAWPAALALLGSKRDTRAALTQPGGYPGWWLARHARFGGRRPAHWRLASAAGLAELYDPVPVNADETLLTAVGVRADLTIADARAADDLLARLADPARHPPAALVADAHIALADAVAAGRVRSADLDLPEHVRALDGSVVGVDVAVVLDAPWPASVLPAGELVIGGDPVALAELLDLPLASEIVAGDVEGAGEFVRWAELGEIVVACHTLGVDVPAGGLHRHDELWVTVRRPVTGRFRVPTWVERDGTRHAQDPLRALIGLFATT